MKIKVIFLLFLFATLSVKGQEAIEEELIGVVQQFFKGFHLKDTSAIKQTLIDDFSLTTIGTSSEDKTRLIKSTKEDFFKGIAGIPDNVYFEEKLLSYKMSSDQLMAHVWTPYEFWFNGLLSHCGVNSFSLMKTEAGWRIISITDTRYKKGCKGL